MLRKFASLVLLCPYAALLYADKQQVTAEGSLTSAEKWADAVVGIVADPQLYQWTKEATLQHFVPLVGTLQPFHDNLMGRNPRHGILYVAVQCENGFGSADFLMPLFDSQQHEVYRLMRAKLKEKLRSPWAVESTNKDWISWRKGDSRFIIRLDKGEFGMDPSGPAVPEPGPYVILEVDQDEDESQ